MLSGKKTFIGIAILIAPTVAGWFGLDITPQFSEEFPGAVDVLVELLGTVIAVYGRLAVQTPGWIAKRK